MYNIKYEYARLSAPEEAMPVYDYKCTACGHRFELLQSISSRGETVCPRCGGKVARVYEGKWAMGKRSGGCSCGGNCQGCSGCGG